MKQRNVLANYTKVSKEELIDKRIPINDIILVDTQNGKAPVVIFDNDKYTYVPSADVDFVIDEIYSDEDEMKNVYNGAYFMHVRKKTSKNGREYYLMFE